ncbi:hypothetical protein GPN2_22469 [Streptomyces murinus]
MGGFPQRSAGGGLRTIAVTDQRSDALYTGDSSCDARVSLLPWPWPHSPSAGCPRARSSTTRPSRTTPRCPRR